MPPHAVPTMRAARIGHDLRAPLQSLVAAAALLRRTPLDDGQRRHLGSIEAATGQLIRLIDELIDDDAVPRTRPEPFAPRKLVEDLTDIIAPRAQAIGLTVHGVVDENVPAVVIGDRPRLERILSNLLHNAVKYTSRGEVTLRVSRVQGRRFRFVVEDTGIGIPAEHAAAIFDPFVQLDPKNQAGGLGLGLAICRELVERLGGTIAVRSEDGRGSTFSVELDLDEATDPDRLTPRPTFDVGSLRFLFVGLDDATANSVKAMLAPWHPVIDERDAHGGGGGPQGTIAIDGGVAGYDVAIVDVEHTPAGIDLQQVPALVLLCAPATVVANAKRSDRVASIAKPVREAELHRALAWLLHQRATLTTTTQMPPDLDGLHLLVVDDDPVNLDYMRLCLEASGARVTVTMSPRLVIGLAQEEDYSAVLLDLEMPGANGVDVIAQLRLIEAEQQVGRTPIIVVSGHEGLPIDRAYSAGATAHLTKPVIARDLVGLVATFARRAPTTGQRRSPGEVSGHASASVAIAGRLKEAQMALLRRDWGTLRLTVQALPASPAKDALQTAVADKNAPAAQRLLNEMGLGAARLDAEMPKATGDLITTGLRSVFTEEARVALDAARAAAAMRDATERRQLQSIAHRIAGSAGLFGYVELGEYARFLDVMLRRDEPGDLSASIDAFLGGLERVQSVRR